MSRFIDQVFRNITIGEEMTRAAWLDWLDQEEKAAKRLAARYLDWYHRDIEMMKEHLKFIAQKTFAAGEVSAWQFPLRNGVPRIIKRISMAYRMPPTRILTRDNKDLDPDAPEYEILLEMYKGVDRNKKLRQADQYSTLLNAVHIEVVPRNGRIDWDLRLRPQVTVIPDPEDYLSFLKFAYAWSIVHPDQFRKVEGWIYWDKDWHLFVSNTGDEVGISLPDGRNPYDGEIPIVTIRKIEQDDYWGRYGGDLVEGFEQANLQLANLWENGFLQTHGQAISINLGLKGPQDIKIGPRHPFCVEDVTIDDVPPDLKYVTPESRIDVVQGMIDWYIRSLAVDYGLPPGAWALDETPESGFAKFMNNIELLENREDDLQAWTDVEIELHNKSVMVWNRWARENGQKEFPTDVEMRVEFGEPSFPETPLEFSQKWAILLSLGLKSKADYFMETENLNEVEAIEKAKHVQEIIDEIAATQKLPDDGLPDDGLPASGEKKDEDEDEDEDDKE